MRTFTEHAGALPGDWQQFLTDAGNASGDTAGTSQAASDVQATLNDFYDLNAELQGLAQGVQIKEASLS